MARCESRERRSALLSIIYHSRPYIEGIHDSKKMKRMNNRARFDTAGRGMSRDVLLLNGDWMCRGGGGGGDVKVDRRYRCVACTMPDQISRFLRKTILALRLAMETEVVESWRTMNGRGERMVRSSRVDAGRPITVRLRATAPASSAPCELDRYPTEWIVVHETP